MCRLAVAAVQKADPRTGSQHPAAIGGSNGQWRAFVQIFQPPPVTFGRMIEANEKHRTNHPAFVFGDAVLTHGEFAKRARTLSSALYRVGCRKQDRSEEHTSELQSLMRHSYAVFCLKKKTTTNTPHTIHSHS